MGWTPVNEMTITRDKGKREIVIRWRDDITGTQEKRFPIEQSTEALEFAEKEFNQLAM